MLHRNAQHPRNTRPARFARRGFWGMARPKSDNPATAQIRIRLTPEDKAAVRKRAEAAGVTMSEYLLRCALPMKEPRTD